MRTFLLLPEASEMLTCWSPDNSPVTHWCVPTRAQSTPTLALDAA